MQRLGFLVAICGLSAACASTGAVPQPFPTPGGSAPAGGTRDPDRTVAAPIAPLTPDQALGHRIAATALELRGVPYRNGGADPTGFDCSGLVVYVFTRHGRTVPRQTSAQFAVGQAVGRTDLRAGDLGFFSTVAPGASHVGIALDDDEFVHAPSSNGVVRVERLTTTYWRTRFVGARRVK